MGININVYLHGLDDLAEIKSILKQLQQQGASIMATAEELVQVVTDVVTAVDGIEAAVAPIAPAVDALEAKVTEALSQLPPGTIPAEVQVKIDAAVATLRGVVTKAAAVVTAANAAVADATDGIDEAAAPANP